jgi:hypothetical protein
MTSTPARTLAALPDALTALAFAVAWIAPAALGPEWVKNLMLTMLFEFIVMHSSAFYAQIAGATGQRRLRRLLLLTGLSCFYLLFVVAFSLGFDSTWPIFVFGWLFVSRFAGIALRPAQSSAATNRLMSLWAASGLAYILGVMATVMLPVPALGLTPEFVASMQLKGGGLWIDKPQTVIVFGALYFASQAWVKFRIDGWLERASTAKTAA